MEFRVPPDFDVRLEIDNPVMRDRTGRLHTGAARRVDHWTFAGDPSPMAYAIGDMLLNASAEDRVAFIRALAPMFREADPMLSDALAAHGSG